MSMRKIIATTRLFNYCVTGLVVLVLVGVFGYSVLGLNQQLAGTRLTSAFHAMQMSMILAHAHCLAKPDTRCSFDATESFITLSGGRRIKIQHGYPAASVDGIILAAGLQNGIYSVRYTFDGLFVYLLAQPNNVDCQIRYVMPVKDIKEAVVTLNTKAC